MGYPKADIDEHGRIIRLTYDEAVGREHELAVQVPVPVHSTDDWVVKGLADRPVFADDPLAVQALPVDDHSWLDRLSPEDREIALARRAAANEAQIGTGHPEGAYDLPPAPEEVAPAETPESTPPLEPAPEPPAA